MQTRNNIDPAITNGQKGIPKEHLMECIAVTKFKLKCYVLWGVELLTSVDISTRAPSIMLNEQHIMACTGTMLMDCKIVLGCKIPYELDALKWKATERDVLFLFKHQTVTQNTPLPDVFNLKHSQIIIR
jgi:hypothetical protein